MKRFLTVTAAAAIFSMSAAAQDAKVFPAVGVMGKVVVGAPYSADEITESEQVLGDGTRISHQSQVTVYRDGEGRVRRDSPSQITIFDPVENINYTLDPRTMTAMKSSLARVGDARFPEKLTLNFPASSSHDAAAAKAEQDAKSQQMSAMLDKLKAEAAASGMLVDGQAASEEKLRAMKEQLARATEKVSKGVAAAPSRMENLGERAMEGVTAEGTRTTSTLEAGAIGNDRPIETVFERWYSAELKTVVMTRRTDPRSGEEIFRLVNVRRGEPGYDLFQLPPGYQLASKREE